MEQAIKQISQCRVCRSEELVPLFSLGEQYVSDFVGREEIHKGVRCPLNLLLCENCTLVQLEHTAPQELLYSRKYWYKSGTSPLMRAQLADVTESATNWLAMLGTPLKAGDVVLDIGSNDGTLLRSYTTRGLRKIGVEPASNLATEGAVGCTIFINDFWSADKYLASVSQPAKLVTACGMFYDLDEPGKFIGDIARVLHPEGLFVAQLMCLQNMINTYDIGNIAHEHLEYYSLMSLEALFGEYGLEIVDIDRNDCNGESYRLYVVHRQNARSSSLLARREIYEQLRDSERELWYPEFYATFASELKRNKERCLEFIAEEVHYHDKKIWGYGASTKGNVILQYYGLNSEDLVGIVDANPMKHGLFTVGTGIQIYQKSFGRSQQPNYFFVLPYAFRSEILLEEQAYLEAGGKFIFPLPKFEEVGK